MINSQNDLKNTSLQIKKYVLGFAFWRDRVALIYKTKGPEYVRETWNGVGGKIEAGETPTAAMAREWFEETGLKIDPGFWNLFATQKGTSWDGPDYELYCFSCDLNRFPDQDYTNIRNLEGDGEVVSWIALTHINAGMIKITPNLKWLLPLAQDDTTGYLEIREH